VHAVGRSHLDEPACRVRQVLRVAAVVAGEHRVRVDEDRAPLPFARLPLDDRVDDVESLRLLPVRGLRQPDPHDERARAVDHVH
jgi:hypothetical protein